MEDKKEKDFMNLQVWQESHKLMLKVYDFVKKLPGDEKYNRVSQLKRSSTSTPANIAEGCGRFYYQENIAFSRKARGSLDETRNHIIAARDLKQAPKIDCKKLLDHSLIVRKLLNGYIRYLNKTKPDNNPS